MNHILLGHFLHFQGGPLGNLNGGHHWSVLTATSMVPKWLNFPAMPLYVRWIPMVKYDFFMLLSSSPGCQGPKKHPKTKVPMLPFPALVDGDGQNRHCGPDHQEEIHDGQHCHRLGWVNWWDGGGGDCGGIGGILWSFWRFHVDWMGISMNLEGFYVDLMGI